MGYNLNNASTPGELGLTERRARVISTPAGRKRIHAHPRKIARASRATTMPIRGRKSIHDGEETGPIRLICGPKVSPYRPGVERVSGDVAHS